MIGVGLGKALPGREDWAAAVAVAVVAFLMLVTKTVHPPAGATAVLAVLDGNWDFVGLVMVSTVVMVVVALVWVNLGGLVVGMRWPLWWWVEGEAVNKEVVVDEVVVDEVVVVTSEGVKVPEWMELGESERRVLQAVWERIVERSGKEGGVQLEEV